MRNKRIVFWVSYVILLGFLYTYLQIDTVVAEEKSAQKTSLTDKPKRTHSKIKKVQGPENKANSSYKKDLFLKYLDLGEGFDKWTPSSRGTNWKEYLASQSSSGNVKVDGGYGSSSEWSSFFRIGSPPYNLYMDLKPNLRPMYLNIGEDGSKSFQGPIIWEDYSPVSPVWQNDGMATSSPLIISQTSDSGTKTIDAMNMYGQGGKKESIEEVPPSIIENVEWYGVQDENSIRNEYSWSKIVYNIRNNPEAHSENTFEYTLKVEYLMGVDSNGAVIFGTRVTNSGKDTLTGFSLGGRYHVGISNILEPIRQENLLPVEYIGGNRGLAYYSNNGNSDTNIIARFYLDTASKPQSWAAGQITEAGHPEQFFNSKYTGFNGPTSTGQEKKNAAHGEIAYSDDIRKANGITGKYQTGLYVKNQPVDLAPNESTLYSFRMSSSPLVTANPELFLDESEVPYDGGSHTVKGSVLQYSEKNSDIDIEYSFEEDGPFTKVTKVLNKSGEEIPWSFEIPEDKLKQGVTQKIYLRAVSSATDGFSEILSQTLVYNAAPIITAEKPNWFFTGSGYTINGTWRESEGETVSLYYSLDNGLPKVIGKNIANVPANTEINFSKEIPSSELGDTSHELSVWAEDVRGGLSKVETWNIGPHVKPAVTADFAIDKKEIDEGGTVLFTSTFKNTSTPSVWNKVIYENTKAFPENVSVDTSSVKLTADGVTVIPKKVEFGADRKLKVELGTVKEQTELKLTYNVVSENGVPPITKPFSVEQAYKLSGETADATLVEYTSNSQSFTINPKIAAVKIRFVDEDGVDIGKVEPINSTAIIGTILDLKQFDTEIQKRLTILEAEHYELVEPPVDKQEITGPLELFYRYKGSLFIGSFPETLNFGDKYLKSKLIKGEQPKYDKELVIRDTRKSKGAWKLLATLEQPLTSEEDPSEVINNVLFYKQDATTKIPLLKGQAQPIETGNATSSGEYNISDKWTKNKTGLELSVYSNKVYQTGKYTASILWQVEVTP
ncbi:hypothetical protein A5821_002144 [Enterococcus sp. 7F3_DIV0205]|uniref:WxL domain-containing protein n=1 Tax=Candidatus Enterococcus palustris TaxID=1834189 RepID=A0AAQ3W945_9ENTE|nr:hypothetical protein [Enterococcus sp. 7F3_DIV0205]OTN82583.1 hypothetical protein A5821_002494 [Enterococcus sp. 7F3_DIV0205]